MPRSASFAAVGLSVALGFAVAQAQDTPSLAPARQALDAARYVEAERLFRAAIEADPRLADAYRGLARALHGQGRAGEAVASLMRAGRGLSRTTDFETAAEYFREAAELAPGASTVRVALGQALLRADRFEAATQELRRAVTLGAAEPGVRLLLGSALWEAGRPEEAAATYREVLDAPDPAGLAARQSLGGLLLWLGRHDEAATLLAEAVARQPASPTLRFDLARALDGAGRTDLAAAAYREVVRLAPEHAAAHYRLGLSLDRLGDAETAGEHLERFRQLHAAEQARAREEGLQRARMDRGYELLQQGRREEAAAHFRGLAPSAESLAGLADALAGLGDRTGAVAALERALLLDPERQDLRRRLAQRRLAEGR
jgi:Flp pilus assembly protein TadD